MIPASVLDYYLALLSVQMAILGFVIAGIVTLIQMLHNAKPRRSMRLLIRRRTLTLYLTLIISLLLFICAGTWAVGFEHSSATFFAQKSVGLILLILTLTGLFLFAILIYRTRRLLEAKEYLEKYVNSTPASELRDYLGEVYGIEPQGKQAAFNAKRLAQQTIQSLKVWEKRQQALQSRPDPFQPIIEYLKDSAFRYDDYGTSQGLYYFNTMFNKAFASAQQKPQTDELYYLAKYFSDTASELFSIFRKVSSERHKEEILRLMQEQGRKLAVNTNADGLSIIIRGLEALAKKADDDDEIILCIEIIRGLTDMYLERHKTADWETVAAVFEETCLSVTRLAEKYYLQRDNPLRTVPIIGFYTGDHRSVTVTLASFFSAYDDLGDRYTGTYPARYFEAVEAVTESLFARYGEIVESGQASHGLNVAYHHIAKTLYDIYRKFGFDAIEHHKPELLALCMSNLRRIIKPAKNFKLTDEHQEIVTIILELAGASIQAMGDIVVKADGRTMSGYTHETLSKHANAKVLERSIAAIKKSGSLDLNDKKVAAFLTDVVKL